MAADDTGLSAAADIHVHPPIGQPAQFGFADALRKVECAVEVCDIVSSRVGIDPNPLRDGTDFGGGRRNNTENHQDGEPGTDRASAGKGETTARHGSPQTEWPNLHTTI